MQNKKMKQICGTLVAEIERANSVGENGIYEPFDRDIADCLREHYERANTDPLRPTVVDIRGF